MRILITGASGFVGSNLKSHLQHSGHEILEVHHEDWDLNIENIIKKFNPELIFHLAAYGNHSFQKDIRPTYLVNVIDTMNLLEMTKDIPYKCFVNMGTSSEYGRKNKPSKETDLLEPESFYAASKVASTMMCKIFAEQFNKPIVTVRPFSLYGQHEAKFRFIPTVIDKMWKGESIPLVKGVHDWVYINDFIDALMIIVEKAQKKGEVYNIGTGKQYSNAEVVSMVASLMGRDFKIADMEERAYDTTVCWRANSNKIKSLGWKPKYDLRKGLSATLEYYLPGGV